MTAFRNIIVLTTVALCPAGALANGYTIDINNVAEVDADRQAPAFEVNRIAVESPNGAPESDRHFDVVLDFGDGRRLTIGSQRTFKRIVGDGRGSDGIIVDSCVAGCLAGADDLLVVSAYEAVEPPGTGHYRSQVHIIARLTDRDADLLLRHVGLASGATRHVREGGLTGYHFRFDAEAGELIETVRREAWPMSTEPRPLYHLTRQTDDEGVDRAYVARIHERIVHRLDYGRRGLRSKSVALYYRTQAGDFLHDISRHYLGMYAPGEAVAAVNPALADHHPGASLTAGIEVRVPVPESWLRRIYFP